MPNTSLQAVLDLELPAPELAHAIDTGALVVSTHAVQRYRERVERVPRWLATRRLQSLAGTAAWRARPLPWMQIVIRPGVIYGYSAMRPDVCLLVRGGVVVTVLSRRSLTTPVPIPAQRTTRSRAQ